MSAEPVAASTAPAAVAIAGLGRRLGALVYDALLIVALMMVYTALLLPFSKGESITFDHFGFVVYFYWLGLVAVLVAFYGVVWTRQGQTVGMMAWRIKLERDDGGTVDWRTTVKRIAAAAGPAALVTLAGLVLPTLGRTVLWIAIAVWLTGFVALLFDSERRTLHDRWSHTRVIVTPKRAKT